MDDGGKSVHGQTIIHTRAFTLKDVEYIQEVLNKNFELRTRLEEKKEGRRAFCSSNIYSYTPKNKVKRYCRSIYG